MPQIAGAEGGESFRSLPASLRPPDSRGRAANIRRLAHHFLKPVWYRGKWRAKYSSMAIFSPFRRAGKLSQTSMPAIPGEIPSRGEKKSLKHTTRSAVSLKAYASPPKQLFASLRVNFGAHCKARRGSERDDFMSPTTYPMRRLPSLTNPYEPHQTTLLRSLRRHAFPRPVHAYDLQRPPLTVHLDGRRMRIPESRPAANH